MTLPRVLLLVLLVVAFAAGKPSLTVYWGQDSANNRTNLEWSLYQTCTLPGYDIVIIGFVISFIDTRQKGMPWLNFAEHCETPFEGYPYLLNCPQIGVDITKCQQAGKKVLLSLGGGVGQYGFNSDQEATAWAGTFWSMFLGNASSSTSLRPFGNATLDGVDLDIEGGTPTNIKSYSPFVNALRKLMNTDTSRKYLITAAPQCPWPDGYLGAKPNTVLGDSPNMFDYVNVQFYNNWCGFFYGVPQMISTFQLWANWTRSVPENPTRPKISFGVPGSTRASNRATDFIPPDQIGPIIAQLKKRLRRCFWWSDGLGRKSNPE